MLILIAVGAFLATLVGGLFTIRFKDKLHLILGFSAGAVIGVAFFDLFPESVELGEKFFDTATITSVMALGFILYLILDRTIFFHLCDDDSHGHGIPKRGILGAASLATHSFMDGVAIGLAFQVSTAVGVIVAIAVLVHDFSDGVNTVNLILKNNGERKTAFRWLFLDALAPVLGIFSTLFFTLPEKSLSIILALFSGFFLYIGASDLVPESHHRHPRLLTTLMTVLGMAVLLFAIEFSHS